MEFIKSPLKEVLTAMLGVPLPVNPDGVFDVSEIEDDEYLKLQDFCSVRSNQTESLPNWANASGVIDAAASIVFAAIANGEIASKSLYDEAFGNGRK